MYFMYTSVSAIGASGDLDPAPAPPSLHTCPLPCSCLSAITVPAPTPAAYTHTCCLHPHPLPALPPLRSACLPAPAQPTALGCLCLYGTDTGTPAGLHSMHTSAPPCSRDVIQCTL
ncbi:hypothetical protein B0H14DRAFT_3439825 [Mycena olivaceomarginata]|nr:hypothetical protein B0H14DRAFT_3439825 [Mycena olivaceomarginata]